MERFGQTSDGREVHALTLKNGPLTARILTWGAVLQGLWLQGVGHSLTLGSERIADYEGAMRYHGSLIAPMVNRIRGGETRVAGRTIRTEINFRDRHTLHSGQAGTHLKLWDVAAADAHAVTLALTLPDGEGGFPGNRRVTARFSLPGPDRLRLEVTAVTDQPTLFNAANHSYWNLDGTDSWAGHRLRVAADRCLPTDDDFCATGEIIDVGGTDFDFRAGRRIAPGQPDIDYCLALARERRPLTEVLWLTGQSGLTLAVATTEPGMQIFDGRDAVRPGRAGYEGFAIEAQGWPDAANHPGFVPTELWPGQPVTQVTEWRLSRAP